MLKQTWLQGLSSRVSGQIFGHNRFQIQPVACCELTDVVYQFPNFASNSWTSTAYFSNSTGSSVSSSWFSPLIAPHQCPGRTGIQCNGGWLVLWKVQLNWESGGCETGALKKKRISTGNHFEEEDFCPDELWNRWTPSGLIHVGPDIIWF